MPCRWFLVFGDGNREALDCRLVHTYQSEREKRAGSSLRGRA
jgi:hypothetical protein